MINVTLRVCRTDANVRKYPRGYATFSHDSSLREEDAMCSPIACPTCGKTTWTGCGMHVDEALAGVPAAQRCEGHDSN